MSLVVDASVAVSWCLRDDFGPVTGELLKRVDREGGFAPTIWQYEVVNALILAERRNRISGDEVSTCIDFLSSLPIAFDTGYWSTHVPGVAEIAQRFRLTIYDASYLELANRREMPLATLDRRLREAAGLMGVPVA